MWDTHWGINIKIWIIHVAIKDLVHIAQYRYVLNHKKPIAKNIAIWFETSFEHHC